MSSLIGIVQLLCYLALFLIPGILIYRRYFHPLSHVPGPYLASVTWLYEYYYDVWLGGRLTFQLIELHKKYGPVIRINPGEVHIVDPEFYDEVFNVKNAPVEKPFKHAYAFGPYEAAISTTNHDLHRIRRAAVNPFFSRRSVLELMPFLEPILENLCRRFEEIAVKKERVNLRHAYAAMIVDFLEEYCFSRRSDRVLMADFDRKTFDNIDSAVEFALVNIHLSWLLWPIYYLPDSLLRRANPALADMIHDRDLVFAQIQRIQAGGEKSLEAYDHRTVFHELASSSLPESEKKPLRLRDEAFVLITAGQGSTALFLKTTTYHIMANPSIHARLFAELKAIMPSRDAIPDLLVLEKMDYLTAVIQEGLRTSHTVSHRLISRFPKKDLMYTNKADNTGMRIPAGTIVGMTSMIHHEDPTIFPDPETFRPERWLECDENQKRMMLKAFTPFGRGSRACLGYNLAMAQMYMILAVVFRRFEFDISGIVRERDIDTSRDLLLSAARKDSKGVIVGIKVTQD